jgi:hypothetical protein
MKMRGCIYKEMAENMKRRESLELKLSDSHVALDIDHEDKKGDKKK